MGNREIIEVWDFSGSSANFNSRVDARNNDAVHLGGSPPWSIQLGESGSAQIRLNSMESASALMTSQSLPNEHTRVTVSADVDDDLGAFTEEFRHLASNILDHEWNFERVSPESKPGSRKQVKSKAGPKRYPEARIREVVARWDNLDARKHGTTLVEFLEDEFGSVNGKLKVPTSTFYSWRAKIHKEDNS